MDKYNLNGIQTELKKEIDRCESILKEWEIVSFPTKKDGKPFAIMSKNFSGASYKPISYAMQAGEYELTICCWTNFSGYVTDTIRCYELVRYIEDKNMKSKTENYLPKISYLEQVYCFDLEDIKQAIFNRIEYLKKRVTALKTELELSESIFLSYREKYVNAIEELKNSSIIDGQTDLFYMIRDTVKERF